MGQRISYFTQCHGRMATLYGLVNMSPAIRPSKSVIQWHLYAGRVGLGWFRKSGVGSCASPINH